MSDMLLAPPKKLSPPPKITVAEFLALYPDESNQVIELLEGEIIVANTPRPQHQEISSRLITYLNMYILSNQLGRPVQPAPSAVYLDPYNQVQPDIFWVAPEGQCFIGDDNHWQGPPDLCVEIISPSSAKHDRQTKFALYERHGVREYWLVSPDERLIEVYVLEEGAFVRLGAYDEGDSFSGRVLPGLHLGVAEILGGE
jgi:Uma2 family endonuclease